MKMQTEPLEYSKAVVKGKFITVKAYMKEKKGRKEGRKEGERERKIT
jgi:hypothetical protein